MFDCMELKNQMALHGVGLKMLSEKSGVNIDTLAKILNHGRTPTLVTIGRLAKALDVEPRAFLKEGKE